ncbi:MAG: hypothetical protein GY861_10775 [bacterium]|nr:hypothetical protein [bacterium]
MKVIKNKMTKVQRYALKKVCQALVRTSVFHRKNIVEYYRIMNHTAWREYALQPKQMKTFLKECQNDAFNEDFGI